MIKRTPIGWLREISNPRPWTAATVCTLAKLKDIWLKSIGREEEPVAGYKKFVPTKKSRAISDPAFTL